MHYGAIKNCDIANGIGVRVSIFVSGCTNACKGCFQPQTWAFDYGEEYTKETEELLLELLEPSHINGLTILGGEPFEPENQPEVCRLVERVREVLPKKSIWIYTGFCYDDELQPGGRKYTEYTDRILNHIDVLVDGLFVEEQKNIMLKFRGSENQRIIDVKETRKQEEIVLDPLNEFRSKYN